MSRVQRILAPALLAVALAGSMNALAAAGSYPTADAAAAALVNALAGHDDSALARVLGDDWHTYIPADDVDRADVDAFVADYGQSHRIVQEGDTSHLLVGNQGWRLPIPLVKTAEGWHFDTRMGHDEILAGQVGNNETSVVQALLAYYDAQRDYASTTHDGAALPHYAAKLVSTPGKHDGLYWPDAAGTPTSPLGPYFAEPPSGDTYFGYHYRPLTAQGPSAPGGAYDYMAGKELVNGFALVAWPARYGETGVMTFEISHDGTVYEKDLGKDTPTEAARLKRFDPDSSWTEVTPSTEPEGQTP